MTMSISRHRHMPALSLGTPALRAGKGAPVAIRGTETARSVRTVYRAHTGLDVKDLNGGLRSRSITCPHTSEEDMQSLRKSIDATTGCGIRA